MKGLGYFEKNGELYFAFEKEIKTEKSNEYSTRIIKLSETIPRNIIELGEKAIKLYTEQRVKEYIAKQESLFEKIKSFEENPDFPVETKHD
jgi:hypothetical protein